MKIPRRQDGCCTNFLMRISVSGIFIVLNRLILIIFLKLPFHVHGLDISIIETKNSHLPNIVSHFDQWS